MRIRFLTAAVIVALSAVLAVPAAQADSVTPPAPVTSALATFTNNPQTAMATWSAWAGRQPMRWTFVAIDRSVCAIDSAGVSRCRSYDRNPSGKGFMTKGDTTYTLPNHKRQIFNWNGRWVYNDVGTNVNPITATGNFVPYDPWNPWLTAGIPVTTSIGKDGWVEVTSTNVKGGDDTTAVYVTRVSPDGLKAQLLGESKTGTVSIAEDIVITNVPTITVPKASKQKL
ncbi:MAG: hypothetical protein WCG77_07470 [Actinomycetes bacterium]